MPPHCGPFKAGLCQQLHIWWLVLGKKFSPHIPKANTEEDDNQGSCAEGASALFGDPKIPLKLMTSKDWGWKTLSASYRRIKPFPVVLLGPCRRLNCVGWMLLSSLLGLLLDQGWDSPKAAWGKHELPPLLSLVALQSPGLQSGSFHQYQAEGAAHSLLRDSAVSEVWWEGHLRLQVHIEQKPPEVQLPERTPVQQPFWPFPPCKSLGVSSQCLWSTSGPTCIWPGKKSDIECTECYLV